MSLLARITTFVAQTFFIAADIDGELDQIVDLLNGTSTDKRIYTQYSDGTLPVLRLNQLGAGDLIDLQLSGVSKFRIANNGQWISTVATGTPPATVASSTLVTNLNTNFLQGYDTTGFLRNDTSGQSLKGGILINKLATGTENLQITLDANTLTFERTSDGADLFTLSLLSAATRLLSFPITTQVQSAYAPTVDNDVARKADITERNTSPSVSFFDAAPAANAYMGGWMCPVAGMIVKKLKASYRSGAHSGTSTFRLLLNNVTNLGEVSLLTGTAVNTAITTTLTPYTLAEDDQLTVKCMADGAHDEATVTVVIDNS